MPRTARQKSSTGIYHILLRGINRQTIFNDTEDREKFIEALKECKEKSGYKVYGYCLMTNHVHLLIKEEEETAGIFMRRIGAGFVNWYNWKYNRCGHLFQDRYKSEVVEDDAYFLTVLRYIHHNPLKAGIIKDIIDYKWSSYPEYFRESNFIETEYILKLFANEKEKALIYFISFHEKDNDDVCLEIDDKKRITDDEAKEIIMRICDLKNCKDIGLMDKSRKAFLIRKLKDEGISTRQMERLTGIARSFIVRA